MKKLVRLTESDLHRIVKESVNRILNEYGNTPEGQDMLAALHARKVLDGNMKGASEISDYAKEKREKDGNAGNDFRYNQAYCQYLGAHQEDGMNEGDLHRIVKESVKKVINEVGDKLEKELGLPKGAGKYALAKKAASLARNRGRFDQSDNFDDYAYDSFNKEFGFINKDGEFGMSGNMRPFLDNNDVPCLSSQDEASKKKRGAIEKAINNFKAYPRMKAKNGLKTFDTVYQMGKNKWKPQEQQPQ